MPPTDPELIAAIAAGGTALGALIGSASGGLVEFVLDRSREARDARTGARLVRFELRELIGTIALSIEDQRWRPQLWQPLHAWSEYQAAIATRLDGSESEEIAAAVTHLHTVGQRFERARENFSAQFAADEASVVLLQSLWRDTVRAYNVLGRLAEQGHRITAAVPEPQPNDGDCDDGE